MMVLFEHYVTLSTKPYLAASLVTMPKLGRKERNMQLSLVLGSARGAVSDMRLLKTNFCMSMGQAGGGPGFGQPARDSALNTDT